MVYYILYIFMCITTCPLSVNSELLYAPDCYLCYLGYGKILLHPGITLIMADRIKKYHISYQNNVLVHP